jgi:hypothetical protein
MEGVQPAVKITNAAERNIEDIRMAALKPDRSMKLLRQTLVSVFRNYSKTFCLMNDLLHGAEVRLV